MSSSFFSGFDVVVDTTGNPEGLDQALNLVAAGGVLVLKTSFREPPSVDMSRLVLNEISLVGSPCGPFDQALELLEEQRVEVEPLIDASFDLADANAAFARAASAGVRKVLFAPGGE